MLCKSSGSIPWRCLFFSLFCLDNNDRYGVMSWCWPVIDLSDGVYLVTGNCARHALVPSCFGFIVLFSLWA